MMTTPGIGETRRWHAKDVWTEYWAGCTESYVWPSSCGHRPSHSLQCRAGERDTTTATVKVVESSSKERVETEKHTPSCTDVGLPSTSNHDTSYNTCDQVGIMPWPI